MKELKGILAFDKRGRTVYQPGDIVGVKAKGGIIPWLSKNAIVPQTDLFHFLLIGDQVGDDYEILESIGKGVAVGRLSWYKDREYTVFRVNTPNSLALGEKVMRFASKFGRHSYDWKLYVRIFAWALGYWLKEIAKLHFPPRPVYPTMIPYKSDQDFICIELVFEAWRNVLPGNGGVRIREHGHAPVPAEMILAQERGDLYVIDQHDGNPDTWRNGKSPGNRRSRQIEKQGYDNRQRRRRVNTERTRPRHYRTPGGTKAEPNPHIPTTVRIPDSGL